MAASRNGATPAFGGDWTETKLTILGGYLDFYTTALKKLPFKLVYIDAFAGDGKINLGSDADPDALDRKAFIAGSAERALLVGNRPFDCMVFVEADLERATRLKRLRRQHPERVIDVVNTDSNEFLTRLRQTEYGNWRGVLFLDPFGTQIDWATIESIAKLERLDMWLLFPVSAIGRMLPLSQVPGDVTPAWETCLTRVYGGESWRELYAHDAQGNLFGGSGVDQGTGGGRPSQHLQGPAQRDLRRPFSRGVTHPDEFAEFAAVRVHILRRQSGGKSRTAGEAHGEAPDRDMVEGSRSLTDETTRQRKELAGSVDDGSSRGELILYATEDGLAQIQLRASEGTVWLTQREIAELFQTSAQAITQLIGTIYGAGELDDEATCKELLQVRTEGTRRVRRRLRIYNLDVILAVGYRVRSPRGTQFRRWATTVLREYLVKGFSLDGERLKDPSWDYFDELLRRIREIRASEARFYRKVRDLLALSVDYEPGSGVATDFFARIQNKMLHAVTGHTAAALIVERSDPEVANMGLTIWKRSRVSKGDVTTGKNYLQHHEIEELNLIVTMFLDAAELRASRRQTMRLVNWDTTLERFLASNELPILRGSGAISADGARRIVTERYAAFDAHRKAGERAFAEGMDDITELKQIAAASDQGTPAGDRTEE